jgi:hypothetical protein
LAGKEIVFNARGMKAQVRQTVLISNFHWRYPVILIMTLEVPESGKNDVMDFRRTKNQMILGCERWSIVRQ